MRHLLVEDGRCLHRTAGYDGGQQGTRENIGNQRKTAEDGGGPQETKGDDWGWWDMVGTVGDHTMLSVLILPQDGRTASLRTLSSSLNSFKRSCDNGIGGFSESANLQVRLA